MRNRKHLLLITLGLLFLGAGTLFAQTATKPTAPAEQVDAPPEKPGADQDTDEDKEGAATRKVAEREPSRGLFDWKFMAILGGAFVLMIWFSSRSRKKQETKRREMLAGLKKGDKVTSIGGVVGTVIEVREDEVTVKVDETNNVRMKFARWAIRGIGDDAKIQAPENKK